MFAYEWSDVLQIFVEKREDLPGRHLFGDRRERANIGEEHRHFAFHVVAKRNVDDSGLVEEFEKLGGDEARVGFIEAFKGRIRVAQRIEGFGLRVGACAVGGLDLFGEVKCIVAPRGRRHE